jgi:1,6-anhydro-N-acetylmuramate kinase
VIRPIYPRFLYLFDHNQTQITIYKVCNLADMVHALQLSKAQYVKMLLELETVEKEIVEATGASVRTVYHIKHNLINHGTIQHPKTVPQGHPCLMTTEMDVTRFAPFVLII